ncbi:extracellular solute-binding protein [Cellulosimicrobium cellulans]|uniref:sugar ABC transporter substrate-binding protein n=1 Tax=Cellulosimicrobium cellulans TaxID=1710 RepID=UPI00130D8B1E|nr:extracellular solute-binding protein [Cellulosimicrobium cellulans]
MNARRTSLIALAAVGALGLAACSGGTSAGGDAGSTSGSGGDGDGVVTVWHYFSDPNQVALMDAYKEKFESENDATVENVYVPYDQMNSKLVSAAGAGTGPDVVVFNGAEAATLALGGVLAPLDEQWADFADADQFPDSVLHSVDDQLYAVQGYVNLLGLWYNQDILDEIGVEPPTTMDELEAAMAAAKDAGYGGITLSGLPQSQGEWQAYPWISDAGFDYENLDADALASGFERVRGWVDNGWLTQEAVTWDQTVPFQQFAAGKTAFAQNGNWQIGTAESDADFAYGVVPLPLGDTGQVYLGGEGEGIGAHADDPELAWEYLQSTYLDAKGQELAPDLVGSIPSRADTAQADVVTSNDLLDPFARTIADFGASYPAASIPPAAVADVQLTVGQAWSAVIGGQQAPQAAADQAVAALTSQIG